MKYEEGKMEWAREKQVGRRGGKRVAGRLG
jgi:hypothetical protein